MIKKLILISALLLITGCSNSSSKVIEKLDTNLNEPNQQPTLFEQRKEEKVEQFIEFPLEDEQVLINLEMVPILREYLNGVKSRTDSISEMKLEKLPLDNHQIYLLEFSCFHDACSYLIFNQTGENPAYLVADLAKSTNLLISPDQSKVALQFSRLNGQNMQLNNLVVIDLTNWQVLSLENETSDANILNYTWPYVTVEWIDEQKLTISTPDVLEPTYQHLSEWYGTNTKIRFDTTLSVAN
ncbi:hypothetical protein ACFOUV_10765 [Oceanobacillus longus]|uniref:Lipoprotein n=1 Tax=Oceanobacillus longus TaxID=930120 RepID=A0ABV8GWS5_9BACI